MAKAKPTTWSYVELTLVIMLFVVLIGLSPGSELTGASIVGTVFTSR